MSKVSVRRFIARGAVIAAVAAAGFGISIAPAHADVNGLSVHRASDVNGLAVQRAGDVNGLAVNGLAVNGLDVNGLDVNGLSARPQAVNGL